LGKRGDAAFWKWSEASEKFDYYIAGLIAAVLVFAANDVSTDLRYFLPVSAGLIGIVCLLGAVTCGLKRIEYMVLLKGLAHRRVSNDEKIGELNQPIHGGIAYNRANGQYLSPEMRRLEIDISHGENVAVSDAEKRSLKSADFYYTARNFLFAIGVILVLASKVWIGVVEPKTPALDQIISILR